MDFHILSTHHRDRADDSPLQFISAQRLAYLLALEAKVVALAALLEDEKKPGL